MKTTARKARTTGLSQLATMFALPHESQPLRLPVVPAALTATLSTMAESTVPVTDGTSRRAVLCRDPVYPLWIERNFTSVFLGIRATGTIGSFTLPADIGVTLMTPVFDAAVAYLGAGAGRDGVALSTAQWHDLAIIGKCPTGFGAYVPMGSNFVCSFTTAVQPANVIIEVEFGYIYKGEEYSSNVACSSFAGGSQIYFASTAGSTGADAIGLLGEGLVPVGFVWVKQVRTSGSVLPVATANPEMMVGWGTSRNPPGSNIGTVSVLMPFSTPPEFSNSRIPFERSRLNASAALFTNVTAALSKEGTVLAARVRSSDVDFSAFNTASIDAVHPSLRYFGPLEKGLYTFTTPSANLDNFDDHVYNLRNQPNGLSDRPLFDPLAVGIYNAIIFSDLGSSSSGTQLAVSSYVHMEFETTSSLFKLGVSTQTLEALHATEVALLKFGHFHENPLHWAILKSAIVNAARFAAPMVAPLVEHYGTKLINAGVSYLRGTKPAGQRSMPQKGLSTPPQKRPQPKKKPARPAQRQPRSRK